MTGFWFLIFKEECINWCRSNWWKISRVYNALLICSFHVISSIKKKKSIQLNNRILKKVEKLISGIFKSSSRYEFSYCFSESPSQTEFSPPPIFRNLWYQELIPVRLYFSRLKKKSRECLIKMRPQFLNSRMKIKTREWKFKSSREKNLNLNASF